MALILMFLALPMFAQQSVGTILGIVRDTSGGSVAGASVTILNSETGQSRQVTTGDDGAYRVPALSVGQYSVKIEKEGFKTQTQQSVVLNVAQELVINASLDVGSSAQEVVVTGEAPIVNTTTSSLGGLVNEQKMAELPLNGRNFIDLSLMQPGVVQNKFQGTGGGMSGTWFSSNGSPTRSNYVTLDGAPMVNQLGGATGSEGGTTLGVDGIREYRVITTNFSAEYGMTMGSQMVIASKGGANQWHGGAFEYLRNDHLDARNFFDTPQTAGLTASGQQRRLPPFQRNNFGASFGGPIKKDKTFFFAVYEGLRQNLGFSAVDTVFPAGCHGAAGQTITSAACPSLPAGTSVVVAPVMAPLLALIPLPNSGATTYTTGTNNKLTDDYGQIRIDQNLSASDSFFGRYTIDNAFLNNGSGSIATGDTGVAYPNLLSATSPSRNQFLTLAESHVFSPTLLNTVRASFSRTNFRLHSVPAPQLTGPQVSFVAGKPMGTFQGVPGLSNIGVPIGTGPIPDNYHVQNIYTLSDDLFFTKGKHALKFGILYNRFNQGMGSAQSPNGQVFFSSLANLLQGFYSQYIAQTQGIGQTFDFIYNTIGLYAQDDYRVSSRLTLNLGLRYEFNTTPWELNGAQAAFRDIFHDATSTPGPIVRNPSLKNFSPRIGFAYDVWGSGKTAIRGGFAEVYDIGNIGNALYQGVISLPPLISQSTRVPPTTTTVLDLPFFSNLATPPSPNTLQTLNYNIQQPHMFQWNLTVEQQLPAAFGLAVSYVGTRGLNLFTEMEANPNLPTSSDAVGLPVWEPFLCGGRPSTIGFVSVLPGSTCTAGPIAPNPAFHRVNTNWLGAVLDATGSSSTYHALQVVVNKRLTRGLQLQSAYTWSHSLDTAQGQGYSTDCSGAAMASGQDPFNPAIDKGPSCFDVKHNWRFNLLYHLPNLKSNGFVSKFTNGWWMGNIVSINSGYPFTPAESGNRSLSGVFTGKVIMERASIVTAADAAACTAISTTCRYIPVPYNPDTVTTGNPNQWFNPNMFELQPVGHFGTSSRGLLRGPGSATWDFSAVKDTALPFLGEKGSLQFRAEFFNILNRANFGMPSGAVFGGASTSASPNLGPNTEAPLATAGKITTTSTSARQVQLALKLVF